MTSEDATQLAAPRNKQQAIQQIDTIRQQRTGKAREALKKEFGLKAVENPLFKLPVDVFRYI